MPEQNSEVMMNIPKADALQHIEITVLRQMGDNIAAQTRHLETLSGKVDDVRERMIRIESKETDERVKALEKRVASMETQSTRISGVAIFAEWMAKSAPWIFAIGAGIVAWSKH